MPNISRSLKKNSNTLFPQLLVILICCSSGIAQPIAFPGAGGYGKFTSGGRGGEVIYVSNLNDSGPGSLRNAVEKKGARIIVFGVSGTITLKSALVIEHGNLTIAGQSAPGEGIAIKGRTVEVAANNVIIRYMRFRLGDQQKVEGDALEGKRHENIIIDHCSISWGTDETATFYWNKDFTMQWCIISESLNSSVHYKGQHGYGGIWGGVRASFHHNLFAHHKSRTPRFSGSRTTQNSKEQLTDFRNNVIYNWVINNVYGGEKGRFNVVKNYYKSGPATEKDKRDRIINPSEPYGRFYVSENYVEGFPKVTADNWAGGVRCNSPEEVYQETPFEYVKIIEHEPVEAYDKVLRFAGASMQRDAVDERVIEEVRAGTATYNGSVTGWPGIIDSQEDVGGWPELESESAPKDRDRDGMPDRWEQNNGLLPGDPSDAQAFTLDGSYTNIEIYLNMLVKHITDKSLINEEQ